MKTAILKTTIDQLIEDELLLDQQCRRMQLELLQAQRNPENAYFSYVTREDLVDCFGNSVVLTMRDFDFYETDAVGTLATELKVVSQSTPVDVRLVTQDVNVLDNSRDSSFGSTHGDSTVEAQQNGKRDCPNGSNVSGDDDRQSSTDSHRPFRMSSALHKKRFCPDFVGPLGDLDGNSSDSR